MQTGNKLGTTVTLLLVGLGLWFAVWLFIQLPYQMANARQRDGIAWVLVSLFGSPLVAIFLLLVLGRKSA